MIQVSFLAQFHHNPCLHVFKEDGYWSTFTHTRNSYDSLISGTHTQDLAPYPRLSCFELFVAIGCLRLAAYLTS